MSRNLPTFPLPPLTGGLTPFAGSPQPVLYQTSYTGANPIPTINIGNSGYQVGTSSTTLPTVIYPMDQIATDSYILPDNATAEIIWNYPNPPKPQNSTSSYRRIGCIGDGSCLFHAILKGVAPLYLYSYRLPPDITEELLQKFESTVKYRVIFDDLLFSRPRNRTDLSTKYQIRVPLRYQGIMEQFRHEFAKEFRGDFASKIQFEDKMQEIIQRIMSGSVDLATQNIVSQAFPNWDNISGNVYEKILLDHPEIRDQAQQQVFHNLIRELLSGSDVQPDFIPILSEYVNFDCYLLRDIDLIKGDPKNNPLYGGTSIHTSILGPQDLRLDTDPRKSLPNRTAIVLMDFKDYHYEILGRVDVSPEGRKDFKVGFDQSEPLIRLLYMMLLSLRMGS